MKPVSEEAHFSLISQREGIINKRLIMVKKAKREIDLTASGGDFIQIFINYDELLKKAIKNGVKVRVILDVTEHEDSILGILEEYESSGASFDLKYKDQPSGH